MNRENVQLFTIYVFQFPFWQLHQTKQTGLNPPDHGLVSQKIWLILGDMLTSAFLFNFEGAVSHSFLSPVFLDVIASQAPYLVSGLVGQ